MTFWARVSTPSAILLVILFFSVGIVANSPEFQQSSGPSAVIPFWEATFNHYDATFDKLTNLPMICIYGEKVNDFQQVQCDRDLSELAKYLGLALSPFGIVGLALFLMESSFAGLYRATRKKVAVGKAKFGGTVTNPPRAPGDLFSWFYCLTPIMVELPSKHQIKVYISSQEALPMAGETLAAFEAGYHFGQKRFVAVVYAPHVAVVRGS